MASTGVGEAFSAEMVLQAMVTMRSADVDKKKAAMDYLQRFQKSVRPLRSTYLTAWPHARRKLTTSTW